MGCYTIDEGEERASNQEWVPICTYHASASQFDGITSEVKKKDKQSWMALL